MGKNVEVLLFLPSDHFFLFSLFYSSSCCVFIQVINVLIATHLTVSIAVNITDHITAFVI
jgi:hypothetical protein